MFEKYVKYVPMGLLFSFGIKALVSHPSFVDAAILLVLGAIAGFYEWKVQNEAIEQVYKEAAIVHKRMEEIDKHLSSLYKNDEEFKSYIGGVRLAQQATRTGPFNVGNR